jgi:hypothetical protein
MEEERKESLFKTTMINEYFLPKMMNHIFDEFIKSVNLTKVETDEIIDFMWLNNGPRSLLLSDVINELDDVDYFTDMDFHIFIKVIKYIIRTNSMYFYTSLEKYSIYENIIEVYFNSFPISIYNSYKHMYFLLQYKMFLKNRSLLESFNYIKYHIYDAIAFCEGKIPSSKCYENIVALNNNSIYKTSFIDFMGNVLIERVKYF